MLDNYTDYELQKELHHRRKRREVEPSSYVYSLDSKLLCLKQNGVQHKDGTEVESYWVQNGNWGGERIKNWFIIKAPMGDSMHEIADWVHLVCVKMRIQPNSWGTIKKWLEDNNINIHNADISEQGGRLRIDLEPQDATAFKLRWG